MSVDWAMAGSIAVRKVASGLCVGVLAAGLSCAGKVRPDEMSAAAHRREAARQRVHAEVDLTRAAALTGGPLSPTDLFAWAALQHLEHATAHERAAAALERFEDAECGPLPPQHRAACPLFGPVRSLLELPDGIRVVYTADAPIEELVAEMKCHLAFARTRGYPVAQDCPLYVRGVTITRAAGADAIDLTGASSQAVAEIRRWVRKETGR